MRFAIPAAVCLNVVALGQIAVPWDPTDKDREQGDHDHDGRATERDAKGPIDVIDWRCGDHAAEIETELHLQATAKRIEAIKRVYACTGDDKRGRLLRETPL